jgi:anti-sigma B factor antagonist
MSEVQIRAEPCDRAVRVEVAGDVDLSASDQLFDALAGLVAAAAVSDVEVDLAQVRFLDASAIGVLLAARHRAQAVGIGFRVRNATGLPRKVLEITGVLGVLGGKP